MNPVSALLLKASSPIQSPSRTTPNGPDPGEESGPRGVARPYRARSNYCRSFATIASMFRSASAVMVTKGLTPTLPGTREPSTT